ncbi:MAG: hypothetical protein ACLQIK_08875 [Mycobacterium sp.]|uniref:hypothetical protein n=1 Tax=Mycobacterium sp. TaxID=1785 RepID=UPI003F959D1F
MREREHGSFVDELARFAAGHDDPRVTAIAERTAAPLQVVVRGRRGVGLSTVARALDRAGRAANLSVTPGARGSDGDVVVYVTAEVVKPEDTDAIAAAHRVVAVLNKADLVGPLSGGSGCEGPVAAARLRCADLSAVAGVPLEPMIGLLAVAALDDLDRASWAALRTLATLPGGVACLDGSHAEFLAAANPVPADQRLRLLDGLDLFGIALGIVALRRGHKQAQVRTLLRRLSGVDAVCRAVAAVGAEVRYRRVLDAVADLEALAVGNERIGAFLSRDDTVLARMTAAMEMAEAAGLEPADSGPVPNRRDDPDGHLPRAARWQRYGRGSASEVHGACGADIARGSLRLWSRACGSPGECW